MNKLWSWMDKWKLDQKVKTRYFLVLNSMLFSIVGFLIWLLVSRFFCNTIQWAICFIGYPGFFIGYLGGYFFVCRKS